MGLERTSEEYRRALYIQAFRQDLTDLDEAIVFFRRHGAPPGESVEDLVRRAVEAKANTVKLLAVLRSGIPLSSPMPE